MARTASPALKSEIRRAPILAQRERLALPPEKLIEIYRLMYLSRRTDDREIILKNQQKVFFQISGAGHEALLVTAALSLRPGYDWFFPYYRDRALSLALGTTVEEHFLQGVGAATDAASGGRQMPSHWTSPKLHIVTPSSSTATQCLQAVGCAEAGPLSPTSTPRPPRNARATTAQFHPVEFHADEVVYVSIGEGATSQGEFWESISIASNLKLPVLFVVEDNGYAISVPVEVNTPGGNISHLLSNFPDFHFAEVDGTDPLACLAAFESAVAHCRARKGPALIHGHCHPPVRTFPFRRRPVSIAPIPNATPSLSATPSHTFQMVLLREGIVDAEAGRALLKRKVDEEVRAAAERAFSAPYSPEAAAILRSSIFGGLRSRQRPSLPDR